MNSCPCCSDLLLRHVCAGQSYFYCQRCRLELPETVVQAEIGLYQPTIKVAPLRLLASTGVAKAA